MPRDDEKRPVLGIDLGTTFSSIARWDGFQPKVYELRRGRSIPSVVYRDPASGEMLAGVAAKSKGILDPANVVTEVKRDIGNRSKQIKLGDKTYTPIDISAEILKKLYKDAAETTPGFESRGVVVTVPYHFKANQIANTKEAALKAGLNCIGVIQEPIAASLAYAWELAKAGQSVDEKILVFDLGGGTFDLTLFHLHLTSTELHFEVLATGGDDNLGGLDFDQLLVDYAVRKSGIDFSKLDEKQRRLAAKKLREQAVETKETLSECSSCDLTVPFVTPNDHIELKITREEFEKLLNNRMRRPDSAIDEPGYLDRIRSIIDKLWAPAMIGPENVDRVIRVGGSSAIPCMAKLLSDVVSAEKLWKPEHPELAVAEGAAMYAAYLDDKSVFKRKIEISSVTSHALGVETYGGAYYPLILPNVKTPVSRRQCFQTLPNVEELVVKVFQGSNSVASKNSQVGTINMRLPRDPKGLSIYVTFKLSQQQILGVEVEFDGTTKEVKMACV